MNRGRALRRPYLDWMRGLAVLIMIAVHIADSWTAATYRTNEVFGRAILVGGFGAPLFLFLAGVSVALSAGSRFRRADATTAAASRAASWPILRRGLEIFVLAFLFRFQSVILSWGPWRTLLKVDILNIMGPSIAAAAAIWGAFRTSRARYVAFVAATLGIVLVTPLVRGWGLVVALPDPLEGYIRPVPGLTNFVFFPWMAFVFAGAIAGMLIDVTATRRDEARVNAALGIAGVILFAIGYGGSHLPSIYARSDFWTTSPSYFSIKVGLLAIATALGYLWSLRPGPHRWSPMEQLGRSSLFIYWIHVEMVYGLMSLRLHGALSLPQVAVAVVAFTAFMVVVALVKDRVVARYRARKTTS